SKNTLYLQMN
nr:immunoglobulin heavy chain junction region [Homo sapiens]